jgi:hypothetical protein
MNIGGEKESKEALKAFENKIEEVRKLLMNEINRLELKLDSEADEKV